MITCTLAGICSLAKLVKTYLDKWQTTKDGDLYVSLVFSFSAAEGSCALQLEEDTSCDVLEPLA